MLAEQIPTDEANIKKQKRSFVLLTLTFALVSGLFSAAAILFAVALTNKWEPSGWVVYLGMAIMGVLLVAILVLAIALLFRLVKLLNAQSTLKQPDEQSYH